MDKPAAPTMSAAAVALQLQALWQQGQRPDPDALVEAAAFSSPLEVAEVLAADQLQRWHAGERISVEHYFARHACVAADAAAALLLVYGEFLAREERGETPTADEYLARFPQCAEKLRHQLEFHVALAKPLPTVAAPEKAPGEPVATQVFCQAPLPESSLAGYQLIDEIGQGGMGVVYIVTRPIRSLPSASSARRASPAGCSTPASPPCIRSAHSPTAGPSWP